MTAAPIPYPAYTSARPDTCLEDSFLKGKYPQVLWSILF